jgi:hypothetical protein
MPTDEAMPKITANGAFGHPSVRPPDTVVDAGPPGVVASKLQATKDDPGAVLPPRSEKQAPSASLAERWAARLDQEG